jgi:hypothetical protein
MKKESEKENSSIINRLQLLFLAGMHLSVIDSAGRPAGLIFILFPTWVTRGSEAVSSTANLSQPPEMLTSHVIRQLPIQVPLPGRKKIRKCTRVHEEQHSHMTRTIPRSRPLTVFPTLPSPLSISLAFHNDGVSKSGTCCDGGTRGSCEQMKARYQRSRAYLQHMQ